MYQRPSSVFCTQWAHNINPHTLCGTVGVFGDNMDSTSYEDLQPPHLPGPNISHERESLPWCPHEVEIQLYLHPERADTLADNSHVNSK